MKVFARTEPPLQLRSIRPAVAGRRGGKQAKASDKFLVLKTDSDLWLEEDEDEKEKPWIHEAIPVG